MVNGNALYEATYHWQTTFPRSNCSYPEGHFSQARHPLPLSCVARCAVRRITKLNAILLSGRPEQAASAALPDWNTAQNEFAVERGLHHVAFVLNGKVRGMGPASAARTVVSRPSVACEIVYTRYIRAVLVL